MAETARVRFWTGLAILGAWLASLGDGFVTAEFHAFDVATPVMLIYAGFLFGDNVLRRRYIENGHDG